MLFGGDNQFFSCPAYPLEDIHDPTGAGDTFAGGLAGYLARDGAEVEFSTLTGRGGSWECFGELRVEAFSLERLKTLSAEQIG